MTTMPVSALPPVGRPRPRVALVTSADRSFRQRLSEILTGLRWQVHEAEGGAQAWAEAECSSPEALIVDSWLPDLELDEFLADFRSYFPLVDLVTTGEATPLESPRGPHRQELLYALRRCQDGDTASWNAAPVLTHLPVPGPSEASIAAAEAIIQDPDPQRLIGIAPEKTEEPVKTAAQEEALVKPNESALCERLPELIGNASCMLEVSRRIRLVASRSTPVLIEGPTGSGKELVAEGLHRLSSRSRKPFIAINCAAIPEALLEAELFGHTRGAFTGAVQGRVGRIEAADGGTLFLDEIGEMPLSLQAKLLRFVECGELQRVGDNETVRVDVRIIAATHRP